MRDKTKNSSRSTNVSILVRSRERGHSIQRLFWALYPKIKHRANATWVESKTNTLLSLVTTLLKATFTRGVVHITGDLNYLSLFTQRKRTILTIHDCGHYYNLKGLKQWLYWLIWLWLPVKLSARVTTVSNSTKSELRKLVSFDDGHVMVIYNCLPREPNITNNEFNRDRPTILQIGSGPHKNLDTLIEALPELSCRLHIVGRVPDHLIRRMEDLSIDYQCEHDVSDERLAEIYGDTDILFFASRHEGFGLPIIEAQALSIPVITSNVYSMPEVAGDGAILVDPESLNEIREAIIRIQQDASFRDKLIANGLQNITRFKPEVIAQQYIDLYYEVAEEANLIPKGSHQK